MYVRRHEICLRLRYKEDKLVLEFYKTFEDGTRKIQEPEPGCWINAIAPTEEERNYLIEQIGVLNRRAAGVYQIFTG